MNCNILSCFSVECKIGKTLSALHFKNKESGGGPGNIKLIYSDVPSECVYKRIGGEAKKFFKLERCLYYIEKSNVSVDISLGDNYTGIDNSPLGSNISYHSH
jgi:hypothetical protein